MTVNTRITMPKEIRALIPAIAQSMQAQGIDVSNPKNGNADYSLSAVIAAALQVYHEKYCQKEGQGE